jgi:hypothetical protein
VLRPKQPIALPEGAEVALAVEYVEPAKPPGSPDSLLRNVSIGRTCGVNEY